MTTLTTTPSALIRRYDAPFRRRFTFALAMVLSASATQAQVAPIPAPSAPGPIVILADRAFDGRGGTLRDVRISIVDG